MKNMWGVEVQRQFLQTMRGMFQAGFGALDVVSKQAGQYVAGLSREGSESQKAMVDMLEQWLATIQRGQEEFRHLVDESFQRAEEFFDSMGGSKDR